MRSSPRNRAGHPGTGDSGDVAPRPQSVRVVAPTDKESARRCNDTLARGELDPRLALHHPGCELTPLIAHAERGAPYRGHEGCRAFWAYVREAFLEWHSRVEEVHHLGEAVLLAIHFEGRARRAAPRAARPSARSRARRCARADEPSLSRRCFARRRRRRSRNRRARTRRSSSTGPAGSSCPSTP